MDVFREKKEWILVWPFQVFFLFVFLIWGEKGESVKKNKKKNQKRKERLCNIWAWEVKFNNWAHDVDTQPIFKVIFLPLFTVNVCLVLTVRSTIKWLC